MPPHSERVVASKYPPSIKIAIRVVFIGFPLPPKKTKATLVEWPADTKPNVGGAQRWGEFHSYYIKIQSCCQCRTIVLFDNFIKPIILNTPAVPERATQR